MEITHIGHSSFKIKSPRVTIVTDPFNPKMMGIDFPKVDADIVTISHNHDDHNYKKGVAGEPVCLEGPGEYEVKGVKIFGIPSFHDNEKGIKRGANTMYHMILDSVSILHCGDLGHLLDDAALDAVGSIDVILIPVGGTYTVGPTEAVEIISKIEPLLVVPMHYGSSALDEKAFGMLKGFSEFVKEMGKEGVVPQPKLTITKDKLPTELTVVVLE